jgi:hypothetical protein
VKRLYLYIKKIIKNKIGFLALIFFVLFLSLSLFSSDFEKKYNLKSQIDKKNGIIWYKHKKSSGGSTKIYPYIGKKIEGNQCLLRMVILYRGPDNLFVKEYIFTVDDEKYSLTPRNTIQTVEMGENPVGGNPNTASRGICEVYDVAANQEEFDLMEKISTARTVKLRYNGVKGYKRVKIHNSSKKAIKDVLDAFKELTGISDLR